MAKEKTTKDTQKKIFVLDTSVIIFDHNAVKSFEEHDLAIPITVLEELDNFKKGNDIKNFEAREFTRFLDELAENSASLQDWIPLQGKKKGKLKVIMNTHGTKEMDAEKIFDDRKNDHKILNAAIVVQAENPDKKVVLVSKDINLRLKAKSLNIPAEDYNTGKVKDIDLLYTGHTTIENVVPEKINELYEKGFCDVDAIPADQVSKNHYYILKSIKSSALAYYNPISKRLEQVGKLPAYGIKPRNAEQAFAIHAVLDPNIKLVSIQGVAGTGKTLIGPQHQVGIHSGCSRNR